jgi:hypothetical protein
LTVDNRKNIIDMINGASNSTQPIRIVSAFPKFLRISNLGKAEVAYALNQGTHFIYFLANKLFA